VPEFLNNILFFDKYFSGIDQAALYVIAHSRGLLKFVFDKGDKIF
jgi:hypothetical protein